MLELRAAKSAFDRLAAAAAVAHAAELLGAEANASAAPAPRAVKTFMFTDIVQSTALVDAMGDEAWEDLLRWHDQTLRSVFAARAGDEIKVTHEGDGFFIAFEDSVTAVQCAVDIQRTLAEHRRTHGFAPQVRIGCTPPRRRAAAATSGARACTRPPASPVWRAAARSS
ncbi:MAG: hypothetical protein V3R95_02055 [Dehalococcoidia bacterium]